jgi:ABC-2 type transport system ATP-binding protein
MRQRLHIARGLLHRPEVLFLDEPSVGLDPVAARDLRSTVADLAAAGTTILLTTHYMAEADELCDRIAVISGGRIEVIGTPAELKRHGEGLRVLEVEAYGIPAEALATIRGITGVREADLRETGTSHVLSVHSAWGEDVRSGVLGVLAGIRIGRVMSREPTLEDAYISIIGRRAKEPVV